jgi:predicted MFS family arabinose efflux permease
MKTQPDSEIKSGTILVLAFACSVAVGNVYFCQPLLHAIAIGFGVPDRLAAFVATCAQIGYAAGILLIVPLADTTNLRRLTTILLALTSLALFAGAFSQTVFMLAVLTLSVTVVTVLPQIIMPVAASLAPAGKSGATIGIVSTGLSLGVVMSRTLSGAVAAYAGSWRWSYVLVGALTASLLLFVPRYMPLRAGKPRSAALSYAALLRSLPGLLLKYREVQLSAALGATVFAAFTSFWATLVFHLAGSPFHLGAAAAGLFGLWGAPGTLAATFAGRLTDRHGANAVNAMSIACGLVAYVLLASWGGSSMAALVAGCNLLTFAASSGQIANQSRIFALGADMRARVNTIYMFSAFAGGAAGSQVGALLYSAYGWTAMCAGAAGFLGVACLLLLRANVGKPAAGRYAA